MTEFAQLAAAPCTDHAGMAALLARELGSPGGAWVDGRMAALARALPRTDDPGAELHGLGVLLARRIRPRDPAPLLLPTRWPPVAGIRSRSP